MSTKNGSFVFRLLNVFMLITLSFSVIGVSPASAAAWRRYAKPTATGTGDCLSWANACTLQTALTGAVDITDIWVMAGTHKPTAIFNRSATFQLKNDVAVYGGFVGTETSRAERDFKTNVTILSGFLGSITGNSYHVVTGATGATLDGFTIRSGNADGADPDNRGGGMYNDGSSPTLTNIIFENNSATFGGGLYNHQSSPILTNVTFNNNIATSVGGGMYNNESNPALTNVTFSANSAGWGGGMQNTNSNPTIMNVTFSSNLATHQGGGIRNVGSSPALTNVTFSSNTAAYGGGMYNLNSSNPHIHNTIFWGNTGINAQIYIENSTPIVSDSVIQGGYASGTNIIAEDPLLGTLGGYGGFTQTVPLLPGSSAINTGNDATCAATDQRGIARHQGVHCDIGAYEYYQTFADVSTTHWAWLFIERLYAAGITGGCGSSPLIYCPNNTVNRAQMAIFLLRGIHGSSYTPPAATGTVFNDVPATYWAAAWIERLSAEGITGGCGTNLYCPENQVTRAEMAIFLLRAEHGSTYTPPAASGTAFDDVPATYWAAAWIEQLAAEGITGGCGANNYCPNNKVTRAEMAVFLVRTFGLP